MEKSIHDVQKVDFVDFGDFVKVGANYLEIAQDSPDEVLAHVFQGFRQMAEGVQWWIGDFFSQVEKLRGNERVELFLREWDVSYSRVAAYKRVCEAIPPSRRFSDLTFTHHESALSDTDDIEEALDLLSIASLHKLSVAQMRKKQRQVTSGGLSGSAPNINFRPFYDAIKSCLQIKPAQLDIADRDRLKSDLKPVVDWYNSL